ncbi:MAG: PKD domain-containing protein [Planctomycetaceae bacterium]|nr:PKD domain-containing protein [Planctomycetaceae bacterium]
MKTSMKIHGHSALSARLFQHAASVLLILSGFALGDIIIDNGQQGTSSTGTWTVSGGTGAYGANSLYGRSGATYTWAFDLPAAGSYEVFMWWTEFSSRSPSVPISVQNAAGSTQLTINQQTNGGKWNSIGTFEFGAAGSVTLSAPGAYPTSYCADAVMVVPVVSAEAIIDNSDPNVEYTGTWPVSGGTGAYGGDSVYCRDAGQSFSWPFTPTVSGYYEVSMWWTEFSSRSIAAPVEIQNASGTASLTVNQQTNGGKWNVLGVYSFEAGNTYLVTIRTLTDRSSICADAVRFVKTTPPNTQADFSGAPITGVVPLNVQFTDLSTSGSALTSWEWDFDNDGTVDSTEQNPAYEYAAEGKYSVKLTVSGADGTDSQTRQNYIDVKAGGDPGWELIIDNGQSGTSSTGTWTVSGGTGAYGANSLYGRNNATYTWAFTVPQAGNYEVFMWWTEFSSRSTAAPVTVTDADGAHALTVNQQTNGSQWNSLGVFSFATSGQVRLQATGAYPTSYCADAVRIVSTTAAAVRADFTAAPTAGQAPLSVQFTDTSTAETTITSWQWDFDNNGTVDSTQQNPTYQFAAAGQYSVKLTVSCPSGTDTETKSNLITVEPSSSYEQIVDNGDPGTSSTGTWAASGASDPYGADSMWARYTATYTWRFTPTQSGPCSVSMWWTVISSRGTAIPVAITHAGGTANLTVNQQQNGGRWNLLGSYNFNAGTEYSIVLRTPGGSPTACADAVRIVSGGGGTNQPPTAAINSVAPNPALRGQTIYFAGSGTDNDGTVTAYQWTSSISGSLSTSSSFSTSSLSNGTHTISFRVQDDDGAWSSPQTLILVITDTSGDEHIYACFGYGTEKVNSQWEAMLNDIGATLSNGIWHYVRAGKDYYIHTVNDVEGMKTALKTPGSHVLYYGHSNFGLGQMFCTSQEWTNQIISDFQVVDDPRILNCSSDTVGVEVDYMIYHQSYPNWFPEFSDGSSAIMPYNFGDPRGNPPYNYYITYRIPGDPTYYRVDSPREDPLERFPGCGKPAWYSSTGAIPSASTTSGRQYYITNATANWRPLFVSTSGWTESLGVSGFWKWNYVYTGAGTGSRTATWRTSVGTTGSYNVYARWSAGSDRASNAPYSITHASGTSTVRVNQTTNGARWNLLGTYNFNTGREYNVVLSNDVSSGNVIADAVMVSHTSNPPYVLQSDFYATPRAGTAPFEVRFRTLCVGDTDKKTWDFGDGGYEKDSGSSFRHTYTRAGTYTVKLTSLMGGQTQSITKTAYIVVGGSEPARAEFSASGTEGLVPRNVTFTNQSSGSIASVLWTFGDGSTSTAANPSHSYSSPGNYTVSLRVNFTNGTSQTVTKDNFVRAVRYEAIYDNITYPPSHYSGRTILSRGPIEVSQNDMKYSRLFFLSCNSGNYYLQTFNRGIVFYSLDDTELGPGPGFSLYLRAYLEGRSNDEILAILQNKINCDYYDFNKRPQDQ